MSQQRDHFRIVFPVGQRPRMTAGLAEWAVIDLSENGAKIAVDGETSFPGRESFPATIRFYDGTIVSVTASVQRNEDGHVILSFAAALSYSLIMAEQRRLLRLFPRESLPGPAMTGSQPITAAP